MTLGYFETEKRPSVSYWASKCPARTNRCRTRAQDWL